MSEPSRAASALGGRLGVGLALVALSLGALSPVAARADAAELCVGTGVGCYAAIQAAIDAAVDGDVIIVGPGTFAGGITIDKSITLVGSGADSTVIEGGGPVVTVGEHFGRSPPTVSIAAVTISGGMTTARFADRTPTPSDAWPTTGGGLWIPPSQGYATGATVEVRDSVITGNVVAPSSFDPPDPECALQGCASAGGGGIDNAGRLTVVDTLVTDNRVGPTAGAVSFGREVLTHRATGGGIRNEPMGTLVLRRSVVSGNRVTVLAPHGAEALAGGISSYGELTITDSQISDNHVSVEVSRDGELFAGFGGIEVAGGSPAIIDGSTISGNSVTARNEAGGVVAGGGGLGTGPGVTLTLRDSTIAGNEVTAIAVADGAPATAFAGGLRLEGSVEVSGLRVVANRVMAETSSGEAGVGGGGIYTDPAVPATLTDLVIRQNELVATSAEGGAFAAGGGLLNIGTLTLRHARLVGNRIEAAGPEGFAQGGGLWHGTLSDQTAGALTLVDSWIAGNQPDDCFGCLPAVARPGRQHT
jgi:hypothetical protein